MASFFIETEVDLTVPITGDIRTIKSPIRYYSEIIKDFINTEIGSKTDLGSIPQFLQGVFPKDGKAMFPYINHDTLYKKGLYPRNICDDILEESMKVVGVSWWRRKAVREGLRVGGWVAWNKHRKGLPCIK